ncbi:hypothetical protein JP31_02680 [Gallibacterium anatis]|nr:hypothetical protein JP31_02680 [Gallibacterium anatis]
MLKTVFIIEKFLIILIILFDKWNEFRYLLSPLKFKSVIKIPMTMTVITMTRIMMTIIISGAG